MASGYLQSRATLKSAEVYDLMLRGRHAADRNDKEGYDQAVTLYKQALDRDATSADASAGLAYAYYLQGANGFLAPAESFEQARQAAATALRLDPKNALAHDVLGKIHVIYDWDWAAAERELQQVRAGDPVYALRNPSPRRLRSLPESVGRRRSGTDQPIPRAPGLDRPAALRQPARAVARRYEVSVLSERAPIPQGTRDAASAPTAPLKRGRLGGP